MRFSIFSVADHYPGRSRTIRGLYEQVLDETALAEELGFSGFFTAEHHFHEYGIVPSPPTLLAAAAGRTERIGLGIAISPLSMHHPLRAAEEYAMLDQITGGRLLLGVGSGYLKHEFDGFSIGPWEKRARFDEALDVVLKAWKGETFSYHGLYHHVRDTRIAVTPLQDPHPPLWMAVLRAEAALHVGRKGQDIMLVPYATCETQADLGDVVRQHAEGLDQAAQDRTRDVAVAFHTYVSESPEKARSEAGEAFDRYVGSRLYARRRSWDELESAGLSLFGDPELVSERVRALEVLGVNHLLLLMNFGALEPERVRSSMELFAREVMPSFAPQDERALIS
jgi:alkanesulfonate monooxygenase SsuD/methylene tetrahydromethanopterin reductase-like flavin-dependent oxidoreductase (luciferase family)